MVNTKTMLETTSKAPEKPNILIAVYGTLRKEGALYSDYMAPHEPIATVVIRGFKMWDLGSYPTVEPTGNEEDHIIAEIYKVPEHVYDWIYRLEHGAGYIVIPVNTAQGTALMFTKPPATPIPSGDWIAYRKQLVNE